MKDKFEASHNLYVVKETNNNGGSSIDVEHNIECLNKMLKSVDEALGKLQ